LSGLVTEGRPLSGSVGIETLAKQRLHLYEAWSDFVIEEEADPDHTVKSILKIIE